MRLFLSSLLLLSLYSCIPLSVAPNIETDKLVEAKKFKRDLPRNYGFVFENPKEENAFYNFINTKYNLAFTNVASNVPIKIDENIYFLSFYERERITKTVNLIPVIVDADRESKGKDPLLEDSHTSRTGYWYIILTVTDNEMKDCLNPNYGNREKVVEYLRSIKQEYLTTKN